MPSIEQKKKLVYPEVGKKYNIEYIGGIVNVTPEFNSIWKDKRKVWAIETISDNYFVVKEIENHIFTLRFFKFYPFVKFNYPIECNRFKYMDLEE